MTRIRSLYGPLLLLFALAIAALLGAPAWAAYVIYVQGTNSVNPFKANAPITSIFNGSFNAGNIVQEVSYPATIGLLNVLTYKGGYGPLPPTLNQSVAIGVRHLDTLIKADQALIKADPNADPHIYVIGYSQGAVVGTEEALKLRGQGASAYQDVTFILPGNPNRAAPSGGGILTQIPIPITIPGVLTVGPGALSAPTPTNGPKIIDVTNQGDPFANFSLANPLGFLAGLVSLLLGNSSPHDYTNTVLTPAMVTSGNYAPGDVVTKTGNLTDVFIPSTTPSPALQQPVQSPPQQLVQPAPQQPVRPAPQQQVVLAPHQQVQLAPHQQVQLAPPVKAFELVSAATQPSVSTPKPDAVQQATKPVDVQQATKPVDVQQVIKPVDVQQAPKPIGTDPASIKPTHTDREQAGPGGKHK